MDDGRRSMNEVPSIDRRPASPDHRPCSIDRFSSPTRTTTRARAMKTQARPAPATRRAAFTLIELAIVMLIIGLIVAFIASVSFAGLEQARIRATQSLITKLEAGI